jgi:hypothetical protein
MNVVAAEGRPVSYGRGAEGMPMEGKREGLRVYAPSGAWMVSGRSGMGTMGTAGTTGRGGGRRGRKDEGGGMYSSIVEGEGRKADVSGVTNELNARRRRGVS